MHLLRETSFQNGHAHVAIACDTAAYRLPAGERISTFCVGWQSEVTCARCILQPVPWGKWRRSASGHVTDFGVIRPAVTTPDGRPILTKGA